MDLIVTALTRTFGFELEVASGGEEVALELCNTGLSRNDYQHHYHCSCTNCNERFGQGGNWFKVQNDSSCGGEVISSPLQMGWTQDRAEGWREVSPLRLMRSLTDVLRDPSVTVDEHCGLHVHVGARDLTDRQLGRLYELVHHYEAVLYRLACGRSERHRGYRNDFNYCRPLSAFDNPVEARHLAKLKSAEAKQSTIAKNKYVVANLIPIDSLGTVEFRLYESTKSMLRLVLYTKLSVALVERAKRRAAPRGEALYLGQVGDDGALLDMLADLQEHVPELVDDQLIDEALWQWSCLPTWQPAHNLRPLRYFDRFGIPLNEGTAEQVEAHGGPTYYIDSHGGEHGIQVTPEQMRSLCNNEGCRHCARERRIQEEMTEYRLRPGPRLTRRQPLESLYPPASQPLYFSDEPVVEGYSLRSDEDPGRFEE